MAPCTAGHAALSHGDLSAFQVIKVTAACLETFSWKSKFYAPLPCEMLSCLSSEQPVSLEGLLNPLGFRLFALHTKGFLQAETLSFLGG